jgi:hypothetical protein
MIPVRLEWKRPTDGVEIAFDQELAELETVGDGRYFRARSDRMIPETYELWDLENPIILRFVNSRTDEDRIKFIQRFGFLSTLNEYRGDSAPWTERYLESVDFFKSIQSEIEPNHIATESHEKIGTWRDSIETFMGKAHLRPTFAIGEAARPQMTLLASSLTCFMFMEIGLVYEAGAEMASCEHCSQIFLTGHMTGRRSSAKYCSDRCRVAAMRARNAAKED